MITFQKLSGLGWCVVAFQVAGISFVVSVAFCLAFLLFFKTNFTFFYRNDLSARQASHVSPALRLGGVALVAGVCVAALFVDGSPVLWTVLFCMLPIFACGLLEDAGRFQSAKMRLSMAAVSSALVIHFSGMHLSRVGITGVDQIFSYAPVAVAFTLFSTVGIVHAFNLVDGLNGLAGAVTLVATAGLGIVAHTAGAETMIIAGPAIIGATVGFVALNFPGVRIFLGDAGAYSLGFILAWLSIFLMNEVPTISPWAVVMLFFWPVTDTLVAMWRRQTTGVPMGRPDRLHFHQVVMRSLEIAVLRRKNRRITNPLTTLIVTPLMLPPAIAGVHYWNDDIGAATMFFVFGALFVGTYQLLVRQARQVRMPLGGRSLRLRKTAHRRFGIPSNAEVS